MWTYLCLIILLLGGSCVQEGLGQELSISSPTTITLDEGSAGNVSCVASPSRSFDGLIALWYRIENGTNVLVMNETSTEEDYQTFYSNDTYAEAILQVLGNIENNEFSKHFVCKANFSDDTTKEQNLTVEIRVPLALNDSYAPEYICLNETESITCTFRGYPLPEVTWKAESEVVNHVENEFVKSTLYIPNIQEDKSYTCVATQLNSTPLNNTFQVSVRDDVLTNVSHESTNENQCKVTWNSSFVPLYTRGYQIKLRLDDRDVTIAIDDATATEYKFAMHNDYVINNVSIAMVLNDCLGPFVFSLGTCRFQGSDEQEDPYRLALIITSSLTGVIIVVLAVIIGIQYYRRKNQSIIKQKSNDEPLSPRATNKYARQPSGSSGFGNDVGNVNEALYAETIEPSRGNVPTLQRPKQKQLPNRKSDPGSCSNDEPLYGNAAVIESTLPRSRKPKQPSSVAYQNSSLPGNHNGYDNEAMYDDPSEIDERNAQHQPAATQHQQQQPGSDAIYDVAEEDEYVAMTHTEPSQVDPPESHYEVSFVPAPVQKNY